eukprot:COSAG04_NODE_29996_length_265_cov_0.783133_1_plen_23_part_10
MGWPPMLLLLALAALGAPPPSGP